MRGILRILAIAPLLAGSEAHTETLYVWQDAAGNGSGGSWVDAFTDLQTALASADAGDEIRVATGLYKPHPTDRSVSFVIPNGVVLKGGYASPGSIQSGQRDPSRFRSRLSGDLGNNDSGFGGPFNMRSDNSYNVVDLSNTDASTVLDGFSIESGEADGGASDDSGGGLIVRTTSDATVRDVSFFTNRASLSGGGVQWQGGNGTLVGCTFSGNHTLTNGIGGGGAMQSGAGSGTRRLYNCMFLRNGTNAAGGGFYAAGDTLLVNTVFTANDAADRGGAIYVVGNGHVCTAHNLTVYGNTAGDCGGIHVFFGGSLHLYSSVLWANTDTNGGSTASQQRCATLGGSIATDAFNATEGVQTDAPIFADADGPDDILGTFDDDLTPGGVVSFITDRADEATLPPDVADLDGDGNTTEPIPVDLAGGIRVRDVGLTGGIALDQGAYELCPQYVLTINAPQSQAVLEGDSATLETSVFTLNCSFFYTWTKDGEALASDGRVTVADGLVTFDPVLPSDAGTYDVSIGWLCGDSPCGYDQPFPTTLSATLIVNLRADFDGNGAVGIDDMLGFLSSWFNGDDAADFDGDGSTGIEDLLGFLSYWFPYV